MAATVFSVVSFLVLFIHIYSMNTSYDDAVNRSLSTHELEMDEAATESATPGVTISIRECMESVDASKQNMRTVRLKEDIFKEVPLNVTTEMFTSSLAVSNCTRVFVVPDCYTKFPNRSVYVPQYETLFVETDYVMNDRILFICQTFSDKMKIDMLIVEQIPPISLACVVISTFCLLLYTVIFIAFKDMRNLPGYCMQSLTVSLLSAYACFYIHYMVDNIVGCTVLGMFILYFFLTSFFWMNTISYDVWKSIRLATAKLRLNTNRPILVLFARYSLYSWGSPLLIIIISLIINYSVSEQSKFKLLFDPNNCWFEYKQAFVMYFAGPLIVLFSANIFFFVSSFFMISDASNTLNQANAQSGSDLMPRLFLTVRLGSVMGFLWLFGITATLTKVMWLWYLCAVFSGLQGICILFNFTVSRRLKKAFLKAKKRKFSTTPTSTTSTGGTSFHVDQHEHSVKLND